jgi:hypothetical protein
MTATLFIEHLAKIVPSKDYFRNNGCPEDLIDEFRSAFFSIKINCIDENDPLLNLCWNYQFSNSSLGFELYFETPKVIDELSIIIIGNQENAVLAINSLGKIVVLNRLNPKYEIYKCAGNSTYFLSALLTALETSDLNQTVSSAGGDDYSKFWTDFLG